MYTLTSIADALLTQREKLLYIKVTLYDGPITDEERAGLLNIIDDIADELKENSQHLSQHEEIKTLN